MKKIVLYIVLIVCLMLSVPFFLTSVFPAVESCNDISNSGQIINVNKEPYDYSKYSKINLLNKDSGEITELSLDEYLLRGCICRDAS